LAIVVELMMDPAFSLKDSPFGAFFASFVYFHSDFSGTAL
jgi:hypothetical protein